MDLILSANCFLDGIDCLQMKVPIEVTQGAGRPDKRNGAMAANNPRLSFSDPILFFPARARSIQSFTSLLFLANMPNSTSISKSNAS
jgi:hypothetical protein